MNNTPNLPVNGQNGTSKNGLNGSTPKPQPLSTLLADAKKTETGNSSTIKEPTKYPAPAEKPADTPAPAPEAAKTEQTATQPQAQPEQPAASSQPEAVKRSRSEEIAFQVEKSRQMQLLNAQLLSLTTKLDELKKFSYTVDQEDDHRYAKFSIFDDGNREFNCKHHGLTAIVVEFLKGEFTAKIEAKENELLFVSQS